MVVPCINTTRYIYMDTRRCNIFVAPVSEQDTSGGSSGFLWGGVGVHSRDGPNPGVTMVPRDSRLRRRRD